MKQVWILTLLVALTAPSLSAQKFRADDPVWFDDDKAINVAVIAKHKLSDYYDFLKNTFGKPGGGPQLRALNINSLGEAPDSSWFQNRHGRNRMSLDALVRGPGTGDGPSLDQPWSVIDAKTEGITPGFRTRDGRGDVYIIKFDPPQNPELATAAEVISTKFFYAIGYNVPENYLTSFTRDQLRLEAKARVSDSSGRERRMTEVDVDAILKRVHRSADGRYRVLASKLLEGTPLGPFQYFGTRPDDPNDIFAHENRRELRGLRVFSAWLNHDDSRAINSLDMLTEVEGSRHVRHYLIDFGSTLGSGSVGPQSPRAGAEYLWDPAAAFKRIVSLGLWDRQWVRTSYPEYASVGRLEAADFKPQEWKPEYPNPAFSNATYEDCYWAAKIVMAFTDDDIRAIVRTGQLGDAAAEDYLVRTLIARRDKIGAYWLNRLSSFDGFSLAEGDLHFDHLASRYNFAAPPSYLVEWFTFDNASGQRQALDGKACPAYCVAKITSTEGNVDVYVRNRDGRPEVIGVERSRE